MKNIKNYIIHALGGFTEEENKQNQTNVAELVQYRVLDKLLTYAHSINGMEADQWCKLVYNKIVAEQNKIHKEEEAQ